MKSDRITFNGEYIRLDGGIERTTFRASPYNRVYNNLLLLLFSIEQRHAITFSTLAKHFEVKVQRNHNHSAQPIWTLSRNAQLNDAIVDKLTFARSTIHFFWRHRHYRLYSVQNRVSRELTFQYPPPTFQFRWNCELQANCGKLQCSIQMPIVSAVYCLSSRFLVV